MRVDQADEDTDEIKQEVRAIAENTQEEQGLFGGGSNHEGSFGMLWTFALAVSGVAGGMILRTHYFVNEGLLTEGVYLSDRYVSTVVVFVVGFAAVAFLFGRYLEQQRRDE